MEIGFKVLSRCIWHLGLDDHSETTGRANSHHAPESREFKRIFGKVHSLNESDMMERYTG